MAEEKNGVSWVYLLGGVAVGAALGVLFAPKKGSELRDDIEDWTQRRREEGRLLLSRIKKEVPPAIENAQERAKEAIAAVKERSSLSKT